MTQQCINESMNQSQHSANYIALCSKQIRGSQ